MNRIVREHYPVADLPEDLREGFADGTSVRVIVEREQQTPNPTFSLDDLFARARPSFSSLEEVADHIRSIREEWD